MLASKPNMTLESQNHKPENPSPIQPSVIPL
jgi:hypothetical protein